MKSLFDENGHLTIEALQKLKLGTLCEYESLLAAKHMSECIYCAESFANSFDEIELVKTPFEFSDRVISKISEKNSNKQFIFYSLRVATAVCLSLVIVFSGVLNSINKIEYKRYNIGIINSINSGIHDFSQKLFNIGGYKK